MQESLSISGGKALAQVGTAMIARAAVKGRAGGILVNIWIASLLMTTTMIRTRTRTGGMWGSTSAA